MTDGCHSNKYFQFHSFFFVRLTANEYEWLWQWIDVKYKAHNKITLHSSGPPYRLKCRRKHQLFILVFVVSSTCVRARFSIKCPHSHWIRLVLMIWLSKHSSICYKKNGVVSGNSRSSRYFVFIIYTSSSLFFVVWASNIKLFEYILEAHFHISAVNLFIR